MVRQSLRGLGWALLVAGVVFGASFLIPSRYSSYATLYFPLAQSRTLLPIPGVGGDGAGGSVSNFNGALVSPVVGSAPQTAIGILDSYACRSEVVRELGLASLWKISDSAAAKRLAERSEIGLDRNGFVKVQVSLEDRELAAKIVDQFLLEFSKKADELSLNVSRKNRQFIEAKVLTERKRVSALEDALAVQLAQSTAGGIEGLGKLYLDVRAKLAEAEVNAAGAKSDLDEIDRTLRALYAKAKQDPMALLLIEDLAGQLKQRRLTLEDARSKFVAGSPELRTKQSEFDSASRVAKGVVDKQEAARQAGTSASISAARAQLRRLEAEADGYARELRSISETLRQEPKRTVAVERLQRQIAAGAQNLAKLESELQLASIAEARDPAQFEIVDPPRPADEANYPRRGLLTIVSFVGAILLQLAIWAAQRPKEA